jgi:hypothetical protein
LVEGLRDMCAKGGENAFFEMVDCFDEMVGRLKGLLSSTLAIFDPLVLIHWAWLVTRQ